MLVRPGPSVVRATLSFRTYMNGDWTSFPESVFSAVQDVYRRPPRQQLRPHRQDSRPPTRIAHRPGVGCQPFTLPSSTNYGCDESCDSACPSWDPNGDWNCNDPIPLCCLRCDESCDGSVMIVNGGCDEGCERVGTRSANTISHPAVKVKGL
jgi:hypothetical protein